ncbi:MAG: glycosyltransferase [Promethearchaeota archaeon]
MDSFAPINNQISIRAKQFCKRFIKYEIFPIILTPRMLKNSNKDNKLLKGLINLKIFRTPLLELNNNLFERIKFYIHWIPFAYIWGKKIIKKHQNEIKFIYASGPKFSTHIIAYFLKLKFKIPIIIEYRDPWGFNPYNIENVSKLVKSINLFLEKKILKTANIIITISSELKEFLIRHFKEIHNKKICIIENGFSLQDKKNLKNKTNRVITFTFIGTLYAKRTIIPLFRIISKIRNYELLNLFDFRIRIFGKYNKNLLQDIVDRLKIKKYIFFGNYLNRKELINEIKNSTMPLHVGESLNYPTIAFKVWDYLSCQKKILYLGKKDSYTADFLKNNQFGITIPLNSLDEGTLIFKNLLKDLYNNRYNTSIEKEKLLKFSWKSKFQKLLTCLNEFISLKK